MKVAHRYRKEGKGVVSRKIEGWEPVKRGKKGRKKRKEKKRARRKTLGTGEDDKKDDGRKQRRKKERVGRNMTEEEDIR
jgi:hypothetical protein